MHRKLRGASITEGPIWKSLLRFFFPILLGTFFQQMYNTVDTIIVGRFVGTQALAGIGATAAMINLSTGFFIGLSSGATVILSQFYGARDRRNIKAALHTGIALALLLGLVVMAIGFCAGPVILRLTGTPESCMADAAAYARIYFSGAIATMIYNIGSAILRAMGDSTRPTVFLIVACFINIVLDLLFVVVLQMGVAGAALATILSQAISAVLILFVLHRLPEDICLQLRSIRLEGRLLRSVLAIGVPAGLQFITFDLSNLLIQSGINSFGDVTIAAWTAFGKTDSFSWMIVSAFGVSLTTFVGQNFGAQKYSRVRRSMWTCLGMCIPVIALVTTLVLSLRSQILSIYTTDTEVIRVGAYMMMFIVPFNVIFVFVECISGAMRGTGYSAVPTAITTLCICGLRVLWLLFVVSRWHTLEMLVIAYPITWVITAGVFLTVYIRGNWLKKRIAACGLDPEQS